MLIKFWGTRGSIPVPGEKTIKYGGNTPCVEIRHDDKIIILDAGSGLREFGNSLNGHIKEFDILLTHYHWDHIQGIPFFKPLYKKENKITFYGITSNGVNVKKLLEDQMTHNYFPITISDTAAEVEYIELNVEDKFSLNSMEIETLAVNHPSPTLTYKIKCGDKSVVYMTDNELSLKDLDKKDADNYHKKIVEFSYGCDYLIHDAMYEEHSVSSKKGWGHSGNLSLAEFALNAKVKNVILFHYNPDHTDEKIDQLLNETRSLLDSRNSGINCIGSADNLEIQL